MDFKHKEQLIRGLTCVIPGMVGLIYSISILNSDIASDYLKLILE